MCAQFIFFGFVWNVVFVVNSSKIYVASSFNLGTEMCVFLQSVFKRTGVDLKLLLTFQMS